MRLGRVEYRAARVIGQCVRELVGVGAVVVTSERTGGSSFRVGLAIGNTARGARHIGLPFARAASSTGGELCEGETDFRIGKSRQSLVELVGQRQRNDGGTAASRHGNIRYRDVYLVRGCIGNTVAARRSWRPALPRRSSRPRCSVAAVVAATAGTERKAEHHEGKNRDRTLNVTCHDLPLIAGSADVFRRSLLSYC